MLRHGPVIGGEGLCYGRSDLEAEPLLPENKEAISFLLREVGETATWFSSPLQRCLGLANLLAPDRLQVEPLLREVDFGLWEGKGWDNIDRVALEQWSSNILTNRPPEGESFAEVIERCRTFLDRVVGLDHDLVLIGHAGWFRALLVVLLELQPMTAFKIRFQHWSVSRVTLSGDAVWLDFLNRNP